MVATLYQHKSPPAVNGSQKPLKPGGYSDSGADIAFALKARGIPVITPVDHPQEQRDYDWVFPDSPKGIEQALANGATVLWLNTVLYETHPIRSFYDQEIELVGQHPARVDRYDDKLLTNELLRGNSLPIPKFRRVEKSQLPQLDADQLSFPLIVKPLRGRGSQGVTLVRDASEMEAQIIRLFDSGVYGNTLYLEQYLPGQEITITVMPPGKYTFGEKEELKAQAWALPPVKRFNHQNGIAPYNGTVAVIHNSQVLSDREIEDEPVQSILRQCEQAAQLVGALAPIRIDCRADAKGHYHIFDLNMKPNMTGASRSHRSDQDSLTLLAARKIGWSYADLLQNMLQQKWRPASISPAR